MQRQLQLAREYSTHNLEMEYLMEYLMELLKYLRV